MIEQESYQCAFVAQDLSAENKKDSFLVVLSHYDSTKYKDSFHGPKLLKFVKT